MSCESQTKQSTKKGQFVLLAVLCLISGVLLVLDNLEIVPGIWKFWPTFSLFLGLGGIWFFKKSGKKDLKPAGVGLFLVLVSIFFFVLNFTSWKHMITLWPTFIGILGVSALFVSLYSEKKRWFAVSGFFFLFLSIIFFLVFALNGKLWPTSLILFGVWLLLVPERK